MITCKYCGVSIEEFRSTCPSCGAPLKTKTIKTQTLAARIREICDEHMNSDFKDGTSIPEKRLAKLKKSFQIFPHGKEIFLYCDTTPFRTGKEGFLICEDGVYWQNSWTTPTSRNFLNWDALKKREITHKQYAIDLGKGDAIETSGLGSDDLRESVLKLFKDLRNALNE